MVISYKRLRNGLKHLISIYMSVVENSQIHSDVLRRNYLNSLKMASVDAETSQWKLVCNLIHTILCIKVGCSQAVLLNLMHGMDGIKIGVRCLFVCIVTAVADVVESVKRNIFCTNFGP
jgi:hypothetical protein